MTPSDVPLAALDQGALDALVGSDRDVEDLYPLTPLQHGLLFHSLYAPRSGIYVEQLSWAIEGSFDPERFVAAWEETLARHPALRSAIAYDGEKKPLQMVRRRVGLPLERRDWRGLPAGEQQEALEGYLAAERTRGFDFAQAPLLRLGLVRMADDAWRAVWSFHHLILDGWSVARVLGEVWGRYLDEGDDRGPPAAPVRPYRDFLGWLAAQDHDAAASHWRRYLAGFRAPTPLGIARPPGGGDDEALPPATCTGALSEQATATLSAMARKHRLTTNTVIQGAWAVLVCRYCGQDDVVFGVTTSGRPPALGGVEAMVGLFINTVALRAKLAPDAPVAGWLGALQADQVRQRRYEHFPLTEAQRQSELPAGVGLFETLLVFENYPHEAPAIPEEAGIRLARSHATEHTNYPLTVAVVPGERLALRICYDRRRFEEATIDRLLEHFSHLLQAIAADPDRPISQLPMLGDEEAQRMLVEWNDTAAPYPEESCIHELVCAQAIKSPEATALVFENRQLSYAELEQRANRLAHHLGDLGVGPEVVVGILFERSPEMVIALLGVLKAGGAYLPLDPDYPKDRLAFMLADASAPIVLTTGELVGRLGETSAQVIPLDAIDLTGWPTAPPKTGVGPGNLAYVIFTSGSTGRPKGVGVTHGGLCNLVTWHLSTYSVTPADRATLVAELGFDAAVWELWPYLAAGASVAVAPTEIRADPQALGPWLARMQASMSFLPTPLAEELLAREGTHRLGLRWLLTGGDRLRHRPPPERGFGLVNHYGPTEATVVATAGEIGSGGEGLPPIGAPIANTAVYVLDPGGNPVPIGVPGELSIGGAGLARGYLARPALTATRFVPDHLSGTPGARLYATGDLVRWRKDATLEFLGRLDHQVKIRGYRVELGEIEAALATHPALARAAVLAREDHAGDKRLVAYVVSKDKEATPGATELRTHLQTTLPDWMVPSAFIPLDALPLTPTGKIDRRGLPAPAPPDLASAYVAPRSPVEEALAEIFSEVLVVDAVGVHDNFFELGGDSLTAIQLLARVADVTGMRLALKTLFLRPTIAGMARSLHPLTLPTAPSEGDVPSPHLVVLTSAPSGDRIPLFLVHPGGASVYCYLELAEFLHGQVPVVGVQPLLGEVPPSIEATATRYLEAVLASRPQGPYRLGGWSLGGLIAFEMARQFEDRGLDVDALVMIDASPPGLARGRNDGHRQKRSFPELDDLLENLLAGAEILRTRLVDENLTALGHLLTAQHEALETYVPGIYNGSAIMFVAQPGAGDPRIVAATTICGAWRQLIRGEIVERTVAGDHFTIIEGTNARLIANDLRSALR